MNSKRFITSILFLLPFLIFSSGCEEGKDDSVTGALFYRETGELKSVRLDLNLVSTTTPYKSAIGKLGNTLSGSYENTNAFSVFKFSKPAEAVLDGLISSKITFNVKEVWGNGNTEFGLYSVRTATDWSDTSRIDPQLLAKFDYPLDISESISVTTVKVDTTSSLTTLEFELDKDDLISWSEDKSFLITNTVSDEQLVSLYSDNSNRQPSIEFITKYSSGLIDTTSIKSKEGTYYISNGIDDDEYLLADGDATGYVFKITIPDSISSPTAFNSSMLSLELQYNLIVTPSMNFSVYRLTEEFTTIEDISIDIPSLILKEIVPTEKNYTIDISNFIHAWHNLDKPNHGLLFKPSGTGTSPNYAFIVPSDSLVIKYTTTPEAE